MAKRKFSSSNNTLILLTDYHKLHVSIVTVALTRTMLFPVKEVKAGNFRMKSENFKFICWCIKLISGFFRTFGAFSDFLYDCIAVIRTDIVYSISHYFNRINNINFPQYVYTCKITLSRNKGWTNIVWRILSEMTAWL
jgi:hypothetical protein